VLPTRGKSSLHGDGSSFGIFVADSGFPVACGSLPIFSWCNDCGPDRMDDASDRGKHLRRPCQPSCRCCPDSIDVAHLARPFASEAWAALYFSLIPFVQIAQNICFSPQKMCGFKASCPVCCRPESACVLRPVKLRASKRHGAATLLEKPVRGRKSNERQSKRTVANQCRSDGAQPRSAFCGVALGRACGAGCTPSGLLQAERKASMCDAHDGGRHRYRRIFIGTSSLQAG